MTHLPPLPERLARELVRVAALRGRCGERWAMGDAAAPPPALYLMTTAIEAGCAAIGRNSAGEQAEALRELYGFAE